MEYGLWNNCVLGDNRLHPLVSGRKFYRRGEWQQEGKLQSLVVGGGDRFGYLVVDDY